MFLIFILFSICSCEYANNSGKIFKGRFALKGEFPYVVSISGEYNCGGMLVKWDKVVTAGHCFLDDQGNKLDISVPIIIGGSIKTHYYKEKSSDPAAQVRKVTKVKFHEKFSKIKQLNNVYYHDVILVYLDKPFEKSSTLDLIRVPATDEKRFKEAWYNIVNSGKTCLGSGWGFTYYDEEGTPRNLSDVLKVVELRPWSDKKCRTTNLPGQVDMTGQGEVCLQPLREGEGTCAGDSGSPLICQGNVYGVYRSGFGCGDEKKNVFFILLWPYLKFIDINSAKRMDVFKNILLLLIIHAA